LSSCAPWAGPEPTARRIGHNDLVSPDSHDGAIEPDVPADPPADLPADLPRRRVALLAVVAVVVLVADLTSKVIAVAMLQDREPVRLAGGALYLVIYRNSGAAFSMATGMTLVLTLVATGVVVAIVRFAPRLRSAGWAVGLGMILGGAAGNLGDRLFRAPGPLHGHVVDFLSFFAPDGSAFPVFNIADSSICVGGALLVLLAALGHEYDGRRSQASPAEAGP
jgi:signal peptidase II